MPRFGVSIEIDRGQDRGIVAFSLREKRAGLAKRRSVAARHWARSALFSRSEKATSFASEQASKLTARSIKVSSVETNGVDETCGFDRISNRGLFGTKS